MFGVGYFASVFFGQGPSAGGKGSDARVAIPLVGPFLFFGEDCSPPGAENDWPEVKACERRRTVMPLAGTMQLTGALVMVGSLLITKKTLVRQDIALLSAARIGSGYGVVAAGSF
jgi:hypothetical protein